MEDSVECMKVKEEPVERQGSPSHFPSSGVDGVRPPDQDGYLIIDPSEDLKKEVKEEPFEDHSYTTLPSSPSSSSSSSQQILGMADLRSHSEDVKAEDDWLKVKEEAVWIKEEPIEEVAADTVNTTTFAVKPGSTWTEDSGQHKSNSHPAEGSTAPLHVATEALPQEPATDQHDDGSETEEAAELEGMDSSRPSEGPSPIPPKPKGRPTKQPLQSKPKPLDPKPKKKAPHDKEKEVEEAMDSSGASESPSPIPPSPFHHQHHSADEEEEEEEEEGYDDEEEQPRAPTTKRTMEEEEEEEIHSGVEADSEEVQQPTPQQPAKKKKGRGGGGGNNAGWSLPDVIEEDLVEWLRSNSYLWLRSTKDYKRKKEAWQMKAEELKISLEHLQKWWKNLKDWYVKLLKKTSGQARKPLTGRDKWVLNSLSFYHSQMQVDLPDTLNTMARSGSSCSSSAPAALTSRPLDEDDDEGMHILSDIESQEAQRARDTTTTTKKMTRQQKPEWTVQLIQHLQENHALLERVLLPQPQSLREAFIRYATDVFRTVSDEEYQELQFSFEEALRRIVARRAGAVPPPQASTSTAPPQASTSTTPPQASTSTTPSRPTTSTTPSLQQMTPLTSLSRYLWSPSTYYGMDHPPQPQLQPESADFTSQQLQEDFP